jgi:hypothetical protein
LCSGDPKQVYERNRLWVLKNSISEKYHYLQPHFGHLVGGAFAVLLLIVNLRIVISSDS